MHGLNILIEIFLDEITLKTISTNPTVIPSIGMIVGMFTYQTMIMILLAKYNYVKASELIPII